jgi:hypothetical protein
MISMLLAAMALGAGLAGGAHARVLGYEGTLTLDFIQHLPTVAFTGGGVATVNGSAGRIPLSSLRLAGGITGSTIVPLTDPDLAPFPNMSPRVTLGTGVLAPISGGGSPLTQNELPLGGDLRLCIFFLTPCVAWLPVPLTVGGTRGAGIGGLITVNTFGTTGIKLSITGTPWTIGATTVSNSVRSGFAHGPASGTTTTAKEGGVVQLVTPIRVTTGDFAGPDAIGIIGTLRVVLVPEPGTGLLLGVGVISLALAGRRKRRGRGA